MLKHTLSALAIMAVGISTGATYSAVNAVENQATNNYWWPNRLDLSPLRKNSAISSPLPTSFNYAQAFKNVDVDELKK